MAKTSVTMSDRMLLSEKGKQISRLEEGKDNIDIMINIVLLGASTVGKTSIFMRYFEDDFKFLHIETIGVCRQSKIVKDGDGWMFGILQARKDSNQYLQTLSNKADGVLFVYDISKKSTFEDIESWTEQVKDNSSLNIPYLLLGNKSDLDKERVVGFNEGKEYAEKLSSPFFECSAKKGKNIEEAFKLIISKAVFYKKRRKSSVYPSVKLSTLQRKGKKSKKSECKC